MHIIEFRFIYLSKSENYLVLVICFMSLQNIYKWLVHITLFFGQLLNVIKMAPAQQRQGKSILGETQSMESLD